MNKPSGNPKLELYFDNEEAKNRFLEYLLHQADDDSGFYSVNWDKDRWYQLKFFGVDEFNV